jgi:hypothetical protein
MHKNFRNSNQKRPIIQHLVENILPKLAPFEPEEPVKILPILERENVKNLIEKRVEMVGKIIPLREDKIKKRLLCFIKKNRVALRYEQACCRHVKQFTVAAFLFCEVCETAHDSLYWDCCKNCGNFNKYRI